MCAVKTPIKCKNNIETHVAKNLSDLSTMAIMISV